MSLLTNQVVISLFPIIKDLYKIPNSVVCYESLGEEIEQFFHHLSIIKGNVDISTFIAIVNFEGCVYPTYACSSNTKVIDDIKNMHFNNLLFLYCVKTFLESKNVCPPNSLTENFSKSINFLSGFNF